MGKLRQLGILYDGNVNLYSQGDVIKGQVVAVVDSDKEQGLKNVKGIWVRFQGKAKTKWTTSGHAGGSGNVSNTHTHTLKENYFNRDLVVFGTGKFQRDVKDLHIPSGRNSFPFQFQLPTKPLPSPFEGKYGYVRYRAKVTLALIRTFSNKTSKSEKLFSITGPTLDLNARPRTQVPVNYSQEIMGCCGCGCTPQAIIAVGLPKQGYVPGESIYAIGHVDNRDGEEHKTFTTKFSQHVTFRSANNRKVKTSLLRTATAHVACPRGRVTDFTVGPLTVPPVPASGLLGCKIIDIQYDIKIEGPGYSKTFYAVIGTVPHRMVSQATTTAATAPPADTREELTGRTAVPFAPVYEAPPPSYEEAVGVIDRIVQDRNPEDYFSGGQFVPRYPYFDLTVDVPSADQS